MNPRYQEIAELFGLTPAEQPGALPTSARRRIGTDADESTALGGQSLSEGDYETAIAHFKRAIEQGGVDASRLVNLGGAYEMLELEPQALRQYRLALKARDVAEPHVGLAQLYKRAGKRREAIQELETAIGREPDSPYLLHKLAELLAEMGYKDRALEFASAAVAGAATDSFYHWWMGDLLISMGRPEEALNALRAAIELSPGDDHLYLRAAIAFWNAGKRSEAIRSVRLASDLDPEKNLYYGLLAHFLYETDDIPGAIGEEKRSANMDDYDFDLLERLKHELVV